MKILYSIVDFKNNTSLQILDANSSLVKMFPISHPKGQVELRIIKPSNGLVVFSIVSEGHTIISKKSVKL